MTETELEHVKENFALQRILGHFDEPGGEEKLAELEAAGEFSKVRIHDDPPMYRVTINLESGAREFTQVLKMLDDESGLTMSSFVETKNGGTELALAENGEASLFFATGGFQFRNPENSKSVADYGRDGFFPVGISQPFEEAALNVLSQFETAGYAVRPVFAAHSAGEHLALTVGAKVQEQYPDWQVEKFVFEGTGMLADSMHQAFAKAREKLELPVSNAELTGEQWGSLYNAAKAEWNKLVNNTHVLIVGGAENSTTIFTQSLSGSTLNPNNSRPVGQLYSAPNEFGAAGLATAHSLRKMPDAITATPESNLTDFDTAYALYTDIGALGVAHALYMKPPSFSESPYALNTGQPIFDNAVNSVMDFSMWAGSHMVSPFVFAGEAATAITATAVELNATAIFGESSWLANKSENIRETATGAILQGLLLKVADTAAMQTPLSGYKELEIQPQLLPKTTLDDGRNTGRNQ